MPRGSRRPAKAADARTPLSARPSPPCQRWAAVRPAPAASAEAPAESSPRPADEHALGVDLPQEPAADAAPGGQSASQAQGEASGAQSSSQGEAPAGQGGGRIGASTWSRYASIETCTNSKEFERVRKAVAQRLGPDCEWIASEKVHGANFCFETDGQRVEYASRSTKLGPCADFFNAHETMPKYHPFVLKAFSLARKRAPHLASLLIYGEYFGGYYPDEPPVRGLKKVQNGVAYSPGHHFYAFDVRLDGAVYMNFDDARELLLAAGFPLVAAPLRRGTLDELLAFDVEALHTTIPAQLGHKPPERFCIAEGIVIRPISEVGVGTQRAMIKKKAEAFWEATNQARTKSASAAIDLCNENRLRAVISKNPALLKEGQEQKLAGLLSQDIVLELRKQEGDATLGKKEAVLARSVLLVAQNFVREHLPLVRADVG